MRIIRSGVPFWRPLPTGTTGHCPLFCHWLRPVRAPRQRPDANPYRGGAGRGRFGSDRRVFFSAIPGTDFRAGRPGILGVFTPVNGTGDTPERAVHRPVRGAPKNHGAPPAFRGPSRCLKGRRGPPAGVGVWGPDSRGKKRTVRRENAGRPPPRVAPWKPPPFSLLGRAGKRAEMDRAAPR